MVFQSGSTSPAPNPGVNCDNRGAHHIKVIWYQSKGGKYTYPSNNQPYAALSPIMGIDKRMGEVALSSPMYNEGELRIFSFGGGQSGVKSKHKSGHLRAEEGERDKGRGGVG